MKFSEFLQEQKEKHAVMAFGRMNPITVGHEKLVNKVKDIADKVGGTAHIVVSHSQDAKKNPLTSAQKLKHAKRAFPGMNVTASDKESPNFLAHAAKLHKQGVTHFHMVGGSDRADEYHKLLHKYNGVKGPHGHFNFKHIEVHSAGDRDPDAEGVEGMSASKMREHAGKGNYKEFRKGVPSKMTDSHAKDMYNDVRRGMGVHEDINLDFEELLVEGVHDQAIFKAVFLAGGPGSGKDYVLDNTLAGHGLTEINSDKALEFLMDKNDLDKTMPSSEAEKRDVIRGKAKSMTELRQKLALLGRNGLIINGTGDDAEKIAKIKDRLEEIGYDTSMVMVNTADEVSKQRNIERGQRGGRTVPEEIRKEKWDSVQASRPELAKMFGDKYMEIDNSEDLRQAPPEVVKAKKDEMMNLYKTIKDFVTSPPSNPAADMWVAHELDKKDTLPIPKDGSEMVAHPSAGGSEEARKLGLQYYGFGRYGKNGHVTHRSVHGKLVEIEKETPKEPTIPVSGSPSNSMRTKTKNVNEEFEELISEGYSLSDSSALNMLLMGTEVKETDLYFNGENDHYDFSESEKKVKLMRDTNGQVRTFMLRRAAAKEAHTKNGTVMKYKNGYVIKLHEENDNVQSTNRIIKNQTERTTKGRDFTSFRRTYESRTGESGELLSEGVSELTSGQEYASGEGITSASQTGTQETGTKNTGSTKITLEKIRASQKKKIKESIDRGIEPGLSMASSGENSTRGGLTPTKLLKKPFEKPIKELTGDETTASIGDGKELELKRKGIDLKSFKANRSISS